MPKWVADRVYVNQSDYARSGWVYSVLCVRDQDKNIVALCGYAPSFLRMQQHNALTMKEVRLMAASPDLLKSCEGLCALLRSLGVEGEEVEAAEALIESLSRGDA